MISLYTYGVISVICILVYAILVLKQGLFIINPKVLILRFLWSLIFGPIILTIYFILYIVAQFCVFISNRITKSLMKDKIFLNKMKNKHSATGYNNMSKSEIETMTMLFHKSNALNTIVRWCAKFVYVYKTVTYTIVRNYV